VRYRHGGQIRSNDFSRSSTAIAGTEVALLETKEATVNAIDLLTEQHAEVDKLIAAIEKGKGDKQALFEELADKLAAHATIEEKIFYPAVKAGTTEELLHESVEEHLVIKRLLTDMMELDPDDDQFDAKLSVMKESIEHHAHKEEEKELFPKVKKLLTGEQLEALGGEMTAMFEDLMTQEPRRQVPAETDEAAHI
jgi:hemerythrin superfamily protein